MGLGLAEVGLHYEGELGEGGTLLGVCFQHQI